MATKPKRVEWTPEDLARHKAIREKYKKKPTYEQLVERGELSGIPIPLSDYLELKQLLHELKQEREASGLTLSDVAESSGIDKAALSRLENGRQINPTLATLIRYAHAVGKRIKLGVEDVPKN